MKESPDYRMKWIRIWPHAWFDSSMRVELTNEERAFWIDIIALAGKSRVPGIICSGQDEGGRIGYPLVLLSSLLVSWTPEQTSQILVLLEKTDRVRIVRRPLLSGEDGIIVEVVNWQKWQSESQRVRKYRRYVTTEERIAVHPSSVKVGRTDVEEEGEVEVEGDKKKKHAQASPSRFAFENNLLKVSTQQDKTLGEAFPWVNRGHEYRYITSWLEANPSRRPRNASRFLHNWFAKISVPTKEKPSGAEERTRRNLKAAGLL